MAHGDWMNQSHDGHRDGFLDMPRKTQYNLMNRWAYKTDTWFLQFGGKFLDEDRLGGQKGFRKNMRSKIGEGNLYGIGITSRRYEGFLKIGYLMPQYENTSMALLINIRIIHRMHTTEPGSMMPANVLSLSTIFTSLFSETIRIRNFLPVFLSTMIGIKKISTIMC